MIIENHLEFYRLLDKDYPILGVDYGLKKTGIAISDHQLSMSMPLKVILTKCNKEKIKEIDKISKQYNAAGIVIGISNDCEIIKQFISDMYKTINLPILIENEYYTSQIADDILKSMGMKRKARNSVDDEIAAKIILQSFLDKIKLN